MNTTDKLSEMLKQTEWGSDFTKEERDKIAQFFTFLSYTEGEIVIDQGHTTDFMAFIVDGEVGIIKKKVSDDDEMEICRLPTGTHFGEMSFIDGFPRSASVKALKYVTLLALTRNSYNIIMDKYPEIGVKMLENIAKMISGRLRNTTDRILY